MRVTMSELFNGISNTLLLYTTADFVCLRVVPHPVSGVLKVKCEEVSVAPHFGFRSRICSRSIPLSMVLGMVMDILFWRQLTITPFAVNNNNNHKPYFSRVKTTSPVMKAGKNDESNSTTVYIENSLEINRDVRKIRKIVNLQAPLWQSLKSEAMKGVTEKTLPRYDLLGSLKLSIVLRVYLHHVPSKDKS